MHSAAQAREGQRGGGGNRKMGSGQLEGGKEGTARWEEGTARRVVLAEVSSEVKEVDPNDVDERKCVCAGEAAAEPDLTAEGGRAPRHRRMRKLKRKWTDRTHARSMWKGAEDVAGNRRTNGRTW